MRKENSMSYKVVYFTRTGISRRVAEKIARGLDCETVEMKDDMNWNGIFGFIKGGYYAAKDKPVTMRLEKEVEPGDQVVLVSPLWAGGLAPAAREFLKGFPKEQVHLVVTSGGNTINKTAGYQSVTNVIKNLKNEEEVLEELMGRLK